MSSFLCCLHAGVYLVLSCRCYIRRYSIGAVPRLVAPVAPVRFRVAARALSSAVERRIADPEVTGSIPVVPFSLPA